MNSNEPDRVVSQDEYNEIFAKVSSRIHLRDTPVILLYKISYKNFQVEADLRNAIDGDLFILEDYVDESPPDCIPESGEEPPKKIFTRRKVFFGS